MKLSFLDKLKIWLWLNRVIKESRKMKNLLDKLNGYKSVFGLLGIVGYFSAKQFGVEPPQMILEASYGLLGIGLAHKLDKATGVITKVLVVISEVLKLIQKKKDEQPK